MIIDILKQYVQKIQSLSDIWTSIVYSDVNSVKSFVKEKQNVNIIKELHTISFLKEQKTTGFINDKKVLSFVMPYIDRSFSRENTNG